MKKRKRNYRLCSKCGKSTPYLRAGTLCKKCRNKTFNLTKKEIKKEKSPNIICKCGAEYTYNGKIIQGALFCFKCGQQIINTTRHHNIIMNEIAAANGLTYSSPQ